jgi:hypothetical protein
MKTMTTLAEVSNRVDALNQNCFDKLVDVPEISFASLDRMRIGGDEHTLRYIAQKSICWRLGIPFNYLAKCPQELQAEQMNHWIKHEKRKQLFVRFDDQEVRAVFTPRYKPVDNFRSWPALMKWATRQTPRFNATWMGSSCCFRFRTARKASKSTVIE